MTGSWDLNSSVVIAFLLEKTGHLARINQVMTSQSHWARVSRRVDVIKPHEGKQGLFSKAARYINH